MPDAPPALSKFASRFRAGPWVAWALAMEMAVLKRRRRLGEAELNGGISCTTWFDAVSDAAPRVFDTFSSWTLLLTSLASLSMALSRDSSSLIRDEVSPGV